MTQSGNDIGLAAQYIREGKLVAFPTETVYGLGADAFNANAVASIFETKGRPTFDPLIVHIESAEQLNLLFSNPFEPQIQALAKAFWPGPLTIVAPKTKEVPHLVTSGLETVGVRMPSHVMAINLIKLAGTPIAAPSANKFGCLSPTTASHVCKQLTGVDYVLDGGPTKHGIESTVVEVSEQGVKILRHGAITAEEIADVVGLVISTGNEELKSLPSPGLLKSHYSPNKPLYISRFVDMVNLPPTAGIILNSKRMLVPQWAGRSLALSNDGNLREMAVNLFAVLHAMEENPMVTEIYIEPVPEHGLGVAIMDRINKAAFSYLKPS